MSVKLFRAISASYGRIITVIPHFGYHMIVRYPLLVIMIVLTAGVYTASVLLIDQTNLDFTDRSSSYADHPFSTRDRAAVSLLTNLGVVQGNPDGHFYPERNLNRAEFVKVALLSHPSASTFVWGPIACFADVFHQDWFSPFVCAAKERGIVQGYSDGFFRPAQPVTYAEAIKILTVLYEYDVQPVHAAADSWYSRYVDGARDRNVLLGELVPYDTPITRSQMARLAAAFRAEHEGELDIYRALEEGNQNSKPEISNSNVQESAASSVATKNEELPTTNDSLQTPTRSHLLLLGQESPPIADGIFRSPGEDADIAIMQVVLDREVQSINDLIIVDDDGVKLSWPLRLYGFDEYNKTFRWEFEKGTEYVLPANTDRRFFVKARLWERGNRGISEELIEVREFSVILRGRTSGQSLQIFAQDAPFSAHQTVQSVIESVTNAGDEGGDLREGRKENTGSFKIRILDPYHVGVALNHITFTVDVSGITLSRPELGRLGRSERIPCYFDGLEDEMIFCPNLPDDLGSIDEDAATLSLFADITFLPVVERHLQISLRDPGAIGKIGAIQWSDHVGRFTWIEGDEPLAVGTWWK